MKSFVSPSFQRGFVRYLSLCIRIFDFPCLSLGLCICPRRVSADRSRPIIQLHLNSGLALCVVAAHKAALSLLSHKSVINGHEQNEQLWPHLSWGLHFLLLRHQNYSALFVFLLCSQGPDLLMRLSRNPEHADFYSQDISHLLLPCPSGCPCQGRKSD